MCCILFHIYIKKEITLPSVKIYQDKDYPLLNAQGTFEFLGSFAGKQVYQVNHTGACETYQRNSHNTGIGRDINDIRETLGSLSRYETLGRSYASPYGERELIADRTVDVFCEGCYRKIPTQIYFQGGGFFKRLYIEDQDQQAFMSCQYALQTFKEGIEGLGLNVSKLQNQAKIYGMEFIICQYFDSVDLPEDGDLVFYPESTQNYTGIYKKSLPAPNSPPGGTVLGKVYPESRFAYHHDVFFLPSHCGSVAEFYRLKSAKKPKNKGTDEYPVGNTALDGLYFSCPNSIENLGVRKTIDASPSQSTILEHFPMIAYYPVKKGCTAKCFDYAFDTLFGLNKRPDDFFAKPNNRDIEKYFDLSMHPKKGDLVCYYDLDQQVFSASPLQDPVHYGIYEASGRVASKWGAQGIYRHPVWHVPTTYGKYLRFYTKKTR